MKNSLHHKLVIVSFLIVPLIVSFISTMHIIELFKLGNINWMSMLLAFTFELGSLSSLMSFSVLNKIKKGPVFLIFGLLFILQVSGNIYYVFNYVSLKVIADTHWLDTFRELLSFFIGETPEVGLTKFILAVIIGTIIPIVSLCFTKSLVDYLDTSKETESNKSQEQIEIKPETPTIKEEIIVETPNNNEIKESEIIEEKIDIKEEPQIENTPPFEGGGISVAVFQNSKN